MPMTFYMTSSRQLTRAATDRSNSMVLSCMSRGIALATNVIVRAEFRVFVEHAERELFQLFESIDRDHNGEVNKTDLKAAFSRAGLAISSSKLDQFFNEVDVNHDGVISFDEWRSGLTRTL